MLLLQGKGKKEMDKPTRFWLACGDYRQATATREEAEAALGFFSEDVLGETIFILEDGDPRLKDYKDFGTMDVD